MTHPVQKPASVAWLLFSFSGRASRKAYILASLLVVILMALVSVKVFGATPEIIESGELGLNILAIMLLSQYIFLALMAKRFHDMDKPGIFAAMLFIPFVGSIAQVALCFIPGDPGPNRYGEYTNEPA